ncbi:MAG: prephenate dehydrogenase/arogenate dehydrogenase family protein [SAR202 cluster bacterium]|nr:prephenate dehydrogenase/arogenate dehydrogenase family protein [SAR202 cluster bacterium]
MDKIAIIGMGLIGTSLGLALKTVQLKDVQLVGVDLERSRANKAHKMGAIDKVEGNIPTAVQDAEIVFIATPVMAMKDVMETIAHRLKDGALVTDTGGTKRDVLQWAKEKLPSRVDFVGGHPMAGKETPGPQNATADLFQGKAYCIVPGADASQKSVRVLMDLVSSFGARPYFIDPGEHDSFVAAVSHLPFITSAALVGCTSKSPQWDDINKLASSGFRDVTRLASGDPIMHRDVCVTNRESITHWIGEMIRELERIKAVVSKENNNQELNELFEKAFVEREKWLMGAPSLVEAKMAADRPKPPGFTDMFFGEKISKKLFHGDEGKGGKERKG